MANNTSIRVPSETLPSIIGLMTDEITKLKDSLKGVTDSLSKAQYRVSELMNQVDALKQENKRLYAMLDHEDENWNPNPQEKTIKQAIETDCEDF